MFVRIFLGVLLGASSLPLSLLLYTELVPEDENEDILAFFKDPLTNLQERVKRALLM